MIDRHRRLQLARHIDWRFLLPTPELGQVALVGAGDLDEAAAIAAAAAGHAEGSLAQLATRGPWDIVIAEPDDARAAYELVRPGGWLLVRLRARTHGGLRAAVRSLQEAGADRIERHWYLPDRRRALRIVPLDDREALRVALSRHGGRTSRRIAAAAARYLVGAGLPPDSLGGEAGVLARRPGGVRLDGWPSLEPLAATLEQQMGSNPPSWILLTPRFAASGHVVLLLLAGAEVRLVAKIARLQGDDGPRHEGRILDALARAGMPSGAAPRSVAATDVGGHAVLVETAVTGRPLDRRLVRTDPARWIGAAARWLSRLPSEPQGDHADLDELIDRPLQRVRAGRPSDLALATLVERTRDLLHPLTRLQLRSVPEHGDLSHPNLLVAEDGELSVLDWELARLDGLPLNDLCFFLGYVALAVAGDAVEPISGLERVLADPRTGAVDALQADAARCGIERSALPALLVACWARAFTGQVERGWADEPEASDGGPASSRYYRLWEGAVDRQARLGALLV